MHEPAAAAAAAAVAVAKLLSDYTSANLNKKCEQISNFFNVQMNTNLNINSRVLARRLKAII